MIWSELFTSSHVAEGDLFSLPFQDRWGGEPWNPSDDDRRAAGMLHTQIVSRVATQRLSYQDGIEQAALESLHTLFQKTRDISDMYPGSRCFDALAWEILNTHVRPFTAKWHKRSQQGALTALDSTDEFREQLANLQTILLRFNRLLLYLRDGHFPPSEIQTILRDGDIEAEMREHVAWGIPIHHGGIDAKVATEINQKEVAAIHARRLHYGITEDAPNAIALALSGGGIRSATFSLGVLVALAGRGLLPQIDYLSTVSGGGYLGSFLSAFLNASGGGGIGLRSNELPFQREDGEAAALRHLRHHCRYLATRSLWQREKMMCAQLYGMALNGLAMVFFVIVGIAVERLLRSFDIFSHVPLTVTAVLVGLLILGSFVALLTMRVRGVWQRYADSFVAVPTFLLLLIGTWEALGFAHAFTHRHFTEASAWPSWTGIKWIGLIGAIPLLTSALGAFFGRFLKHIGAALIVMSALAAPLFFLGIYLVTYEVANAPTIAIPHLGSIDTTHLLWAIVVVGSFIYTFLLDVNFTSPHRHYRDRLANAFLVQPGKSDAKGESFDAGVSVRLSALGALTQRGPYHLLNCALNVPGSKRTEMQGRLTDFFLFSPAFSGSPLTGYYPTSLWEEADSHLDLGTAMAISGAAAAPQMGLSTKKTLSFWLVLLNIRLGYWARVPKTSKVMLPFAPGLGCLVKEAMGTMNEHGSWLNLTDGGHIENLGVYELLRRRCKYIIAIDGEEDRSMTFHALTTLQRLAAIDLGVHIDINLDDLRLNEHGLSRSHFRFCRIRYPSNIRGSQEEFGYLLYVKLSLTGNEGEFIRRYRVDDPAFPHDPTANQFFSEAQFEAYRSLGEHIGDKLFLRSIVGDCADSKSLAIEEWFSEIGKSLLTPLSTKVG
jgi:hypothetical protein